jgi:hypothetical protein
MHKTALRKRSIGTVFGMACWHPINTLVRDGSGMTLSFYQPHTVTESPQLGISRGPYTLTHQETTGWDWAPRVCSTGLYCKPMLP